MSESKIAVMIKKAIHDCEITTKEYDRILNLVHEDGKVDAEEKSLLAELQSLLANGTVKRVK